jgi:hypothetical protein
MFTFRVRAAPKRNMKPFFDQSRPDERTTSMANAVRSSRWVIIGPCLAVSILPSALLTAFFAAPGTFFQELPKVWLAFLMGPLSAIYIEPGSKDRAWALLAGILLPALLAHAISPRTLTAVISVTGFLVWYAAALIMVGRSAP